LEPKILGLGLELGFGCQLGLDIKDQQNKIVRSVIFSVEFCVEQFCPYVNMESGNTSLPINYTV
jgi:hypothetical protein